MRQRKRKLLTIAILALALLVGGTFAYTAFNQQVINDRANALRSTVPGRVHDYYNRDTGNKDIFAENYGHDVGDEPIMIRIRLSEYMDTQRQGEDDIIPLVDGAERDDVRTWTPYRTAQDNINVRTGDSLAFDDYIRLTFGWQREGQDAPWYMPTFNHELESLKTAAAGHARDYIQGDGATDGETDGATHPGDGTDAYWTESGANSSYNNSAGTWPGATITQETKPHLQQERPPMTLWEWERLPVNQRFGNFWVLDHNTGWAYWAELLEAEQATSYLLDEAVVREEMVRRSFVNVNYYYAIHVDSQFISPLDIDRFLEPEVEGAPVDTVLEGFLEEVAGDGNPRWNRDSQPSDFNFEIMRPGRIFTMAGQQFRYLEDMGNGNHMIIRNQAMAVGTNWNNRDTVVNNWYNTQFLPADPELREQWEEVVAPVASTFPTTLVNFNATTRPVSGIIPNLPAHAEADRTRVISGGVRRAFTLSVADVNHLTSIRSFFTQADRGTNIQWWLRTPDTTDRAWNVTTTGTWSNPTHPNVSPGVRPALIIHQ